LHFALQVYQQTLTTDQKSALTWNGLGLVLLELGRAEDARNAFARAVENGPEFAEAHYNLSFVLGITTTRCKV
jgi:Flp pilus assembly protein TadD